MVMGRMMMMRDVALGYRVCVVGVKLVAVQAWTMVGLEFLELSRTLTLELTLLKLTLVAYSLVSLGKFLRSHLALGGFFLRTGWGAAVGIPENGSCRRRVCVVRGLSVHGGRL